MYRPAGPTWKIAKRTRAEIREIHRTHRVMLLFLLGEGDVDGPGQGRARPAGGYPPNSEDTAVRLSSRFLSNLAVVVSSLAVLTFIGTAMAATDPSGSGSLPSITVQAPKQVVRPQRPTQRAVTRSTGRRHAVSRGTSLTAATPSGGHGQESVLARLHRIERETHSCDDGCQSSFPKGNRPWVGCSASAWPMSSAGCRNPRHFTSYVQCTEHNYFLAWKPMEVWWYCSNLALNK